MPAERRNQRRMPIIKARPNCVRTVRHLCRLQEPNRDALVLSARLIGDAVDDVLNHLIETALLKDRAFLTWRQGHPGDVVMPTPRRHGRTASAVPAERRAGGV